MKGREFFSSASFKSIVVLILIAVVLGGALSILNDVLYVSAEEEVNRAIKKIYGREIGWEEKELDSEFSSNEDYGEINTVYLLEDGNYLVQSTGADGYKKGTVTLWGVRSFDGGQLKGIEKISYAGNQSQSLMSKFGDEQYKKYLEDFDGGYFDSSDSRYIVGGATYTSHAITNSVNMALFYAENALGGNADES